METRLQQLREEKNISQGVLAKELGVTRQAYSRYERGERELNYNSLIKLAKFFDVSIDYLLGNSVYFYPDAVGTDEERELLMLFDKMTSAQKVRFIAYGEGMLGESTASKKKA